MHHRPWQCPIRTPSATLCRSRRTSVRWPKPRCARKLPACSATQRRRNAGSVEQQPHRWRCVWSGAASAAARHTALNAVWPTACSRPRHGLRQPRDGNKIHEGMGLTRSMFSNAAATGACGGPGEALARAHCRRCTGGAVAFAPGSPKSARCEATRISLERAPNILFCHSPLPIGAVAPVSAQGRHKVAA